jgi:Ni/Co efflux regulator RcnB
MGRMAYKTNLALVLAIAGMFAAGPALSAKPSWAEDGKGGKSDNRGKSDSKQGAQWDRETPAPRDSERAGIRTREYFGDQHRTTAQQYYQEEFKRGRCPPGLAKKQNGCMPPGQAKKWTIGRPLPRDVIFYDVPPALVVQFGRPPAGHRYVRVAADILLIAIGTGMVIDAMQDLGRMR